jgi:hypothetical protein
MKRSTAGLWAGILIVPLAWAGLLWLTGDEQAQPGEVDAVCDALRAAEDGDVSRARAVFYDEAHDPLHALAATTAERDRPAAAELLEAKEGVESMLDADPDLPELAQALRGLADATAAAVPTGDRAETCP